MCIPECVISTALVESVLIFPKVAHSIPGGFIQMTQTCPSKVTLVQKRIVTVENLLCLLLLGIEIIHLLFS